MPEEKESFFDDEEEPDWGFEPWHRENCEDDEDNVNRPVDDVNGSWPVPPYEVHAKDPHPSSVP